MRIRLPTLLLTAALLGVAGGAHSSSLKLDSGTGGGKASDSHGLILNIVIPRSLKVDTVTEEIVGIRLFERGNLPYDKILVQRGNYQTLLSDKGNERIKEQYERLLKQETEIDWNDGHYRFYELNKKHWKNIIPPIKAIEPEKVNGVTASPKINEFGMTSFGTMALTITPRYYEELHAKKLKRSRSLSPEDMILRDIGMYGRAEIEVTEGEGVNYITIKP